MTEEQTDATSMRMKEWHESLPETGLGEDETLAVISRLIEQNSARLGSEEAFAHMDPPPPRIAVEVTRLNAQYNQNLLHPDLSPLATEAEIRLINWLAPFFSMEAGHMCAGSTLANLTALWCAREHGARRIVSSADAHISIPKSAHILGLPYESVPVDAYGRLDTSLMPKLDDAALVLTAGTTGRGVIDPLGDYGALWTHVDAAWAGPLRLTHYRDRLDGIERADSNAISAHKWFFQPKDSALVLFADRSRLDAISFGSSYLARPNVGIQGSRGAAAVTLLATLIAWGREGLEARLAKCMEDADALAERIKKDERLILKQAPETGVVNWRPKTNMSASFLDKLRGTSSSVNIDGEPWMRNVAANPHADIETIWARICESL